MLSISKILKTFQSISILYNLFRSFSLRFNRFRLQDYGKWYIARLRLLDNALADGREFLCCGRLTLADICAFKASP